MRFAIWEGERIEASPGLTASCPNCSKEVIAKCGEIKIWHWAHKANLECDPWWEPETIWHREWKLRFPSSQSEVVRGNHRADVVSKLGWVIELQNSPLSTDEIREREQFYGTMMIWILNGREWTDRFILRKREYGYSFRWKHPRLSWAIAQRRVFIDFGNQAELFEIRKLHNQTPCGGWGRKCEVRDLITMLSGKSMPGKSASLNPADFK